MTNRLQPTKNDDLMGYWVVSNMDVILKKINPGLGPIKIDTINMEVPTTALCFIPMVCTYTLDTNTVKAAFVFDANPVQSLGSIMQTVNYFKYTTTDKYEWLVVTKSKIHRDALALEDVIVVYQDDCGVMVYL